MFDILSGLRVVEAASFIAAPSCALHMAQLGAEVIRIDQIGGGPDFKRWPLSRNGDSFYWEGLNKGKKSIAIDLSNPEGRELAAAIIAAPGEDAGLFVTNFPAKGFLAHDRLAEKRSDLITARIMGWADGQTALDYTVNAAVGIPLMTGPPSLDGEPVNHVLPAWDIAAGLYAAFALIAAERKRLKTGQGGEIRVPLADVAMAFAGHLGMIGEVTESGTDRPRHGNDLFGSWGRNFATADGKQIMLVAITRPQWADLLKALEIEDGIAALEASIGLSLAKDDGLRFTHREAINAIVAPAVARRSLAEWRRIFAETRVCWSPYLTVSEGMTEKCMFSDSPLFSPVAHKSGYTYPTPGAAADFVDSIRQSPVRAPRLGENTEQVLADLLGLSDKEIAKLHDTGIVAGDSAHD
ncbi:CoA transferase [Hwanghaeella sp.]|uniref:CoA transferase n=1 Tax=Hwanghaeella sp. TaxID=2605943 RepID=UPI003CCC0564